MNNSMRTICAVGLLLACALAIADDPARKLEVSNVMSGKDVTHAYFMNGKQAESLTVKDGDDILVVLKDLNPLLFDIKIEGETIAAPKEPGGNPFVLTPGKLTQLDTAAKSALLSGFLTMRQKLVGLAKGDDGKLKPLSPYILDAKKKLSDTFGVSDPSESVTSATIKQYAEVLAAGITDGSKWDALIRDFKDLDPGLPVTGKWDPRVFEAWWKDLGEFVDEINKLSEPSKTVKVKLNDPRDGFAINVNVTRKAKVHGIDSPLPVEPKAYSDRFVVKAAEPAKNQQGAAGFVFSFVPDQSFAVDTTTNKIVKRGNTNNPSIAVGYLYHFKLTGDRLYFTMGATASEASSLSYMGGFSMRMGDKKSSGFLTLGFIASQVTGLDGVALGQTWTDPKVPTKKFYRSGIALGFSFSTG